MALVSLDLRQMAYDTAPVLGRLSLTVMPGQTLAITGPSGIGKSTLLRILAGLEHRFDGSLSVQGRTAMVFQEPVLLPWRSARDNIRLTTGVDAETADALLRDVGLAGLGARHPGQLSLGQQRRLSLARAFAVRPDLLLLDEPFVSLDGATAGDILSLFERLRDESGVATLLVTHSGAEATRLADQVLHLKGSPAQFAEPALV